MFAMSIGNLAEHSACLVRPSDESMDHWSKDNTKQRPDLEMLSLSSASPGVIEDAQANCEARDAKLLDKPGILSQLHHASPLESITELSEVDDANEHRSPGDGAVRFREANNEATSRAASLTGDLLGQVMDYTRNLPNQPLDPCTSEQELGIGLHEDALNATCGFFARSTEKNMTSHQLTSSHTSSGILDVQLDNRSSARSLEDLQDEKEEPMSSQTVVVIPKLGDESELVDEPNSEDLTGNSYGSVDATEPFETNQTLIQILTACEVKVEQLEKLKSSSFQLSNQLHSARALAARLHQRVLYLENEGQQKERELQRLTARLEEMSKALEARDGEMSAVREELQRLRQESEANNMTGAGKMVVVNGQVVPYSSHCNDRSRVCTVL